MDVATAAGFAHGWLGHEADGLVLLRGQLNDSDTRRQQKREYQPTRFHIGKLIGPSTLAEIPN